MSTSLILAFKTTTGKTHNIRIQSPKSGITRAQAEAVMQAIIDKNVFQTGTGASLASIDTVYSVVTSKNEVLV